MLTGRLSGNDTDANWARTYADLRGAMSGGTNNILLQAIIFPKNDTGTGNVNGLVNVTGSIPGGPVKLPAVNTNGSEVYLGDPGLGFPPQLYPNLTYTSTPVNETFNESRAFFDGSEVLSDATLIIGPYAINETFYLLSMTVAIHNNTSHSDVLGWMTVILNPSLVYDVITSPEGLQETGEVLLVGPATSTNRFTDKVLWSDPTFAGNQDVRFVFPPQSNSSLGNRHDRRALGQGDPSLGFPMRDYPAVVDALTKNNTAINNAGAMISSRNEEGHTVSVGYSTLSSPLVDWILLFEQSHDEVVAPINHLRNVVLACVFGTTGLIMVLLFPLAHFSVRPIRQLREATSKTVQPIPPSNSSNQSLNSQVQDGAYDGDEENTAVSPKAKKEGFLGSISRWKNGPQSQVRSGVDRNGRRSSFKIPGKVPQRKHWINDELSDLTATFNEMSDELVLQYARLEERVKERTAELEESKKAAETANASKTLFIANISHELKTPLNGILGMCTVCMQEDDIRRIRQSLGIIYKSGDLLLHLLTDLLTFSKNSIGQQLTIDESEFRLIDVSTQVTSIFEKQAREGEIDLQLEFLGTADAFGNSSDESGPKLYGPAGTGRVRDMCLWGDKNRILQVLINLVSNSLKFTPPGGSVHVKIQCIGMAEDETVNTAISTRKASVQSKQSVLSRQSRNSWKKKARTSDTSPRGSSANSEKGSEKKKEGKKGREINVYVAGAPKQIPQVAVRRRSLSPPPLNTKHLLIEFAVTDTGPGIPEEQMSKIFEPFVQGDLGLSKKYAGTGLGLSICAQLANLMGGGITLQSTVGVGSTFSARIPLRYIKERAASTSSSHVRLGSAANSIVGQPLHDDLMPRNVPITNSSSDDVGPESPPLEDVPRIVGFSQPYFPQEVVRTDSPQKKLSEMKKAEHEAAKTGEKVRVLVAEDNKVNQEVVTRMLKLESVYGEYRWLSVEAIANTHKTSRLQKTAKKRSTWSANLWNQANASTSFSWTYKCPISTAYSQQSAFVISASRLQSLLSQPLPKSRISKTATILEWTSSYPNRSEGRN
jgi:osomolarity two-component system, sensor histidine kinase SLN1